MRTRALWCKVLVLLSVVRRLLQRAREDSCEYHEKEGQNEAQIQVILPVHASELANHHDDETDEEPLDGPQKCRRGILRKERLRGV